MNFSQQYNISPSLEDGHSHVHKKRKMCESNNSVNNMTNERENVIHGGVNTNRSCGCHIHCHTLAQHFITLQQVEGDRIFHTEDWQPSGSALFSPLTEDVMINTRNIEQFSCSRGTFFVAGNDGVYSKNISGEVLHLWRFCPQQRKLFISRSFLFTNAQDFGKVQQALQRL